jgi:hypothetical protein
MSTIKMAGRLPKDHDQNGLEDLYTDLVREPRKARVAVVLIDTAKITKDIANYDTVPTVRILAIEAVAGDDAGKLRAMLQRAHAERTGNLELPAEWEAVLTGLSSASPTLPGTEPEE